VKRLLPLLFASMLLGVAAPATQTLDGIAIGSSIHDAVKLLGNPEVVNTDVGHVWTWKNAKTNEIIRVTTDDDGTIQMVDIALTAGELPQPAIALGAKLSTSDGSLPDSGDNAEFRRYDVATPVQVILAYDTAQSGGPPLREAFLGNADALANAGLVPDKAADDAEYRAPLLDTIGSADYNGNKRGVAYSRIVINPDGTIAKSAIFISSGDADLDRVALAIANGCTFEPATLRGRKVTGIYFRRENFLINS
jgi:TonB family protein